MVLISFSVSFHRSVGSAAAGALCAAFLRRAFPFELPIECWRKETSTSTPTVLMGCVLSTLFIQGLLWLAVWLNSVSASAVRTRCLMFFLAGYRNGSRRHRSANQTREPIFLPSPVWFKHRLDEVVASSGLDASSLELSKSAAREALFVSACKIEAVVLAQPGKICVGQSTDWDAEEDLQWNYFGRPRACVSVKVKEVVSLKFPSEVSSARGVSGNVKLQHLLFQGNVPPADEAAIVVRRPGQAEVSLRQVLCEWGMEHVDLADVPILWVAYPITRVGATSPVVAAAAAAAGFAESIGRHCSLANPAAFAC